MQIPKRVSSEGSQPWLNNAVEIVKRLPETAIQGSRFRLDILGIRGLAILLVLANHFQIPGFDFGFVGVDIFFVVSGYLIVGLMHQEYLKNGRSLGGYGWISISSFFQRRARRILPSSLFVLTIVYIVTLRLNDPNFKLQTSRDVIWAILFASNINFGQRQTDYFSSVELQSPLLHYWSLGVEEQFYLLMPFFFMAIANWHGFSISGRRLSSRPRIFLMMALISVSSFISMIVYFNFANRQEHYYSTFMRVWEFGLGALAALTISSKSHKLNLNLLIIRRISFAAFLISLLILNEENYQNIILFPLVSMAIIIYCNNQFKFGFAYDRIFTNRFLTYFGKISFSLYLWHWPILIFAQYFGFDLTWYKKFLLFLLVVVISTVSERYVERPFLRVGYMSEFHLSPLIKSRRIMAGALLVLTSGLFLATYQPLISSQIQNIQSQRQQPFWTPPSSEDVSSKGEVATSNPKGDSSQEKIITTKYMGIFGDSTNQCCSATGAFWPRLVAKHFGLTFADYSKPATTYLTDGVGSNGCEVSADCPSVIGQLSQASGNTFDVIAISSGIGDCEVAQKNPASLQDSLTDTFQKFKVKYPKAKIFVMGLTYPKNSFRERCVSAVNTILDRAANNSGITFLDNSTWLNDPGQQMTRDGAHLNEVGHLLMANKVIEKLKK